MNKKILVVDKSQNNTEFLRLLLTNYSDYKVEVESNYENIVDSYTNDKYEFIIFDHNCEIADALMEYILTNNSTQRCILLSDSINCPVTCDMCLDTFKFVRLLKPLNPKDILFYIDKQNEFICPNRYVFDNIDTLEKLYEFLNLEQNVFYKEKEILEDKILIKTVSNTNIKIDELDKLQANINSKFFSFEILPTNDIQIVKI